MTNDDVRRAQQRIQDIREVTRRTLTDAGFGSVGSATAGDGVLRAGVRVLDRITGREGEISDVVAANAAAGPRIYIRYDDGGAAVRLASDLVARPTPPAGRS